VRTTISRGPGFEDLLRRPSDDSAVRDFIGGLGSPGTEVAREGESALDFPESGISMIVGPDRRITAIQFFSSGRDGFRDFAGVLPLGLRFSQSRPEVRGRLGDPHRTGGGGSSHLYRDVPRWDRYDWPSYSLHLEYAGEGEGISLVTLMTPESTPGRVTGRGNAER
jgi:hypothetical protein